MVIGTIPLFLQIFLPGIFSKIELKIENSISRYIEFDRIIYKKCQNTKLILGKLQLTSKFYLKLFDFRVKNLHFYINENSNPNTGDLLVIILSIITCSSEFLMARGYQDILTPLITS